MDMDHWNVEFHFNGQIQVQQQGIFVHFNVFGVGKVFTTQRQRDDFSSFTIRSKIRHVHAWWVHLFVVLNERQGLGGQELQQ